MFEFLISLAFGYQIAKRTSSPSSKIYNKLPVLKIKFIQFLPNFKIYFKSKVVHLHHWIYLSFVLILSFYSSTTVLSSPIFKGLISGGIIQGFSFSDWKKVISRKEEQNP